MAAEQLIEASKVNLHKIYEKHRAKLGTPQYFKMIDELQAVYADFIQKEEVFQRKPGLLDVDFQAMGALMRERDLKVVLIKQKYGI
jgi:hypothetical protein